MCEKGSDIHPINKFVDPDILQDLRSIEKDISEAADYLSVGWNTANYKNYSEAVKRYFDYIVTVESAYDIIIIIDSEKRFNLKNLYYVYTYQADLIIKQKGDNNHECYHNYRKVYKGS